MTHDRSIDPEELHERLRRGDDLTVLDVRNRDEFEAWHVDAPRTVQTPYVDFVAANVRDEVADVAGSLDLREPVVAVCARGEASGTVAGLLREAGIDAANLEAGMEGWARVYVSREVSRYDGPGTLFQYQRPASGCLAYLLVSEGEAAVIDPLRAFADRYAADARERGAELRYAVDTHVHADHVSGVREAAESSGAEPVLPDGARDRGLAFDARLVEDGDELVVGDATLAAVHAPGHTSEMTLFRVGNVLLSADTLFLDGVGRPDLERGGRRAPERTDGESEEGATPGASPNGEAASGADELAADLYDTLRDELLPLPDDTLVAPGHVRPGATRADDGTYTAALGDVRDAVPLLDVDEKAFVERVAGELPPRPANYEEIIEVNLGRASVPDERAFELELGPNNCAV